MSTLIFTRTPLTETDYLSINRQILWKERWWFYVLLWLVFMAVMACNFIDSRRTISSADLSELSWVLLPPVLFMVYLAIRTNQTLKRSYRNTAYFVDGVAYTLTESSITGQGPHHQFQQPWPLTQKKARLVKNWAVLYASATTAYFLDLRVLEGPATIADVEGLFQSKGITLKK